MNKPKFGLNSGAVLTGVFLKTSKAGKPYVVADIKLGERTFKWFGFIPDRAWDKELDGWVTSGPRLEEELDRFESTIYDLLEAAGLPKEDRMRSEDVPLVAYLEEVIPKCKKNFVDVWLEYEPKIREGQDRTWLVLPKNNRFGSFIAPATAGTWKAQETADDDEFLVYVDEDTGEQHRFTRSNWYCNSNYAKVQGVIGKGKKSAPQGKKKTTEAAPAASKPVTQAAAPLPDLPEIGDDPELLDDDLPF